MFCTSAVAGPFSWQQQEGHQWRALSVDPTGRTGFQRVPSTISGIRFTNTLASAVIATNRVYENGSGVAAGDVDGDGLCDLYFCSLQSGNRLYRNRGHWEFEDITATAGVRCDGQASMGAVLADVDGDGDLDLLVNGLGVGTRLYLNDGKAHFHWSEDSGLSPTGGATSMALGDLDGDGDLDLYVTNYRTTNYKDRPPGVNPEARKVGDQIVVSPADRFLALPTRRANGVMLMERGEADVVYRNDGRGHFTPIPWMQGAFLDEDGKALTEPPLDWGLSVMIRDLNGDGRPDIYVCNDFFWSRDRCWLNQGGGVFKAAPRLSMRCMSMSSMSVDVADINRDGFDDLFVADMLSRHHSYRQRQKGNLMKGDVALPVFDPNYQPELFRNTLFVNRGDGTYAELAQLSGVEATEWTWGCAFLDVDLDGYEDLLITNGNEHDVLDADSARRASAPVPPGGKPTQLPGLLGFPRLATANLAYRNRGDLTFEERSDAWGFNEVGVSQGMILADLDGDGDMDVVVNNMNSEASLYRNESDAPRLSVRLQGKVPNSSGIGARIQLRGGAKTQSQMIVSGGRYLSGDEAARTFAAGASSGGLEIEVQWPGGARSLISNAIPNRAYVISETLGQGSSLRQPPEPDHSPKPLFLDVSAQLGFSYPLNSFDDFRRQPLLPFQLSQLAPGVSWIDVDGDGLEDLVVGGDSQSGLSVFRNQGDGHFNTLARHAETPSVVRPHSMVLGWNQQEGKTTILAALSNYEDATTNGALLQVCDLRGGKAMDALRARAGSPGPMAMADIDGDGDLDLFIGTRVLPGQYPSSAPSYFYRNEGGRFRPDNTNNAALRQVGMVSGAVFSDLNGDGHPDLALACEWGPVRVFINEAGVFKERTDFLGFAKYSGWWNAVCVGDFDGDGRMDLAASNWGRNTKYQSHLHRPIALTSIRWAGEPSVPVETYYDRALQKEVAWAPWDELSKSIPMVRERFESYAAYSLAGIQDVLGPLVSEGARFEATTLDSMVFLNRGDHFEARSLPGEAQWAPGFGVCSGDFDGDGAIDLFLAQNFFGVPVETSRYDGGRGVVLLGDGKGGFHSLSGSESGILIYGQQRGAAVSDFDGDGRLDLAVAQHGGELKLYHNAGGHPGIRVRIAGAPGNVDGVGAVVRLGSHGRWSPAQEIHAGGGFWLQDSATLVLHGSGVSDTLSVRWPDGHESRFALPPRVADLVVTAQGQLKVIR